MLQYALFTFCFSTLESRSSSRKARHSVQFMYVWKIMLSEMNKIRHVEREGVEVSARSYVHGKLMFYTFKEHKLDVTNREKCDGKRLE